MSKDKGECRDCDGLDLSSQFTSLIPRGNGKCSECHGNGCGVCSGTGQCQTCGGTGYEYWDEDED